MAALLVAGATVPAGADATAAAAESANDEQNREIIVTAPPLFRDIQPEISLDEDAIASYGVSTIDELLGEVQSERGDDQEPLILVNGKRVNDINDIGALPVEALRSIQVLPRGLAVRAGGKVGQRVISLTLKNKIRSATLTAAHKLSTDGQWNAERGEALLTSVHGQTRANVAFRARDESDLLESERGIIQPAALIPYAVSGNLVGYPSTSGEIDPLLSALAGQTVMVAAVPTIANPTLTDFAANANRAAVTDIGQYRTLRPATRTYDLNGSFATELAPWLTANATAHLNRGNNRSERGLPSALFVLPTSNPASPFSKSVGLAYYDNKPLIYRTRHKSADANLTFNANWGSWSADFNARYSQTTDISRSDRQAQSGSITLADSTNPFATDLSGLITLRRDSAKSKTITSQAGVLINGPAFDLPAGTVQVTFEGKLEHDHLHSTSTFSSFGNLNTSRSQQSLRGAAVVPLTSSASAFLGEIGDLSASAEFSRIYYSNSGTEDNHAFGLTWDPRPILHAEADVQRTTLAPPLSVLGEPTVITPDSRVFDPLTGQTVDVSLITGGNPHLRAETDRVRRVSAILRLVPSLNLQANAEYTDTERRNFVSALPEASAAVMLAFPERYIRDANGVLTTVDLRPVNFDSDREKRLRWGLSMNVKLGGGPAEHVPGQRPSHERAQPLTLFQLTANHTIVFSDKIVMRPGLPSVDLLSGGAIGISSGRVRHQLDGTASLTAGGLGVRAGIAWRGKSSLESQLNGATETLTFSPLLVLNARVFADANRILPHSRWAKGFRISLDVLNLTNDRQKVRDSLGNTPLQYQPGYRDPLGRTIEIELRKVF